MANNMLPPTLIQMLSSPAALNNECDKLWDYAMKHGNSEKQPNIINDIKRLIRSFGSDITNKTIECYGSWMQLLEIEGSSDIDIVVGDADACDGGEFLENEDSVETIAACLLRGMLRRPQLFENATRPYANIKCTYRPTNLKCDFSFFSVIGYKNSILIRRLMDLDQRARKLALFLKLWSAENGMRYHLQPYLTNLLVIFYLQKQGILPSVRKCQKGAPFDPIGVWECRIAEKIKWKPEPGVALNVGQLVRGFFDFYNNFDFKHNAICVFSGKVLPRGNIYKKIRDWIPWGIRERMKYVDLKGYAPDVNMCIMGPFEFNNAAHKRIGRSDEQFERFLNLIATTHQFIENNWH